MTPVVSSTKSTKRLRGNTMVGDKMPRQRRKAVVAGEQFYTDKGLASRLTREVLSLGGSYDLTVEPSAGKGAFSSAAPGRVVAFDLEPKAPGIIQADWLEVQSSDLPEHNNLLVLGNPPFGRHSKLAEEFIRHAVNNLSANTVAFILPQSFGRYSKQVAFPSDWRLVKVIELSRSESMFEYNSKRKYVRCDFFVWTKDPEVAKGVDYRDELWSEPKEFAVLKRRQSEDADLSVKRVSAQVAWAGEVGGAKEEWLLKVKPGYDAGEVLKELRGVKFRPLSGGGPPHLSVNCLYGAWHRRNQG